MKDDVTPETAFKTAIAGMLRDAPRDIEQFAQLYNERNNSPFAPKFEAILAEKGDNVAAARRTAVEYALGNGFAHILWVSWLAARGPLKQDRLERVIKLVDRATKSSGLAQGITDAAKGLGSAKIFLPLAEITQAIGFVYHEGLAKPVRGTGFLVGPDLFLTVAHVIQSALARGQLDPTEAQNLSFVFPNNVLNKLAGVWPRQAKLAPDGLIKISPPFGRPPQLFPDDRLGASAALDFALLRLDRPIGDEIGWVDVLDPPEAKKQQQLVVIGHPGGQECLFDMRNILDVVQEASRLRHTVNT